MTELPGQVTGQHIDHRLDPERIQQTFVRWRAQPARQRMPAIDGRDENAFSGDTQQFAQQADLTLEAHTGLQQIMAGNPVKCFVLKRQANGVLHRLTVQGIERETAWRSLLTSR